MYSSVNKPTLRRFVNLRKVKSNKENEPMVNHRCRSEGIPPEGLDPRMGPGSKPP